MVITSTSNKQVLYANSLKEKKYRDKEKKFLIEGEHLLSMANNIECIFTTFTSYHNDNVPVYYVSEEIMKKISFTKSPQGLVAIVLKDEVKIDFSKKKYLLCDGVSDPGNVGTIIRTALAFNVDYVILANGSVDVYNDKVIRGSQGAIFKIPVCYGDMSKIIDKLHENNIKVYASTLSNRSIDLKDIKKIDSYALVVGNEGSGVSDKVIQMSDYNIKIKHSSNIDSLNVGVATSIMLYYFSNL